MAFYRCGQGGKKSALAFTGTGSGSFNISAYPGATVNNFIVESSGGGSCSTSKYEWGDVTSSASASFSFGKSISGNILTVTCRVNLQLSVSGSSTSVTGNVPFKVYYIDI